MNTPNEKERLRLAEIAMRQHGSRVVTTPEGDRIQLEYRQTRFITQLHDYATKIANHKDPKFVQRRHGDFWKVDPDTQAKRMLSLLSANFQSIHSDYPNYRQSPYFDAIERVARRIYREGSLTAAIVGYTKTPLDEKSAKALIGALSFIAKCLRNAIRAAGQDYYNFSKNAKERHKRLHARVYAAMRKRSRLTILRPDTSYSSEVDQTNINHADPGVVTPDLLSAHRAQFGKYLNARFGSAMLDYFGEAEYGKDRKWHIHWIIILDAAKHQSDVLLTKQLGEHWKTTITGGLGHYWNCNAHKHLYRYLAIGKVDVNGENFRLGLRFMLAYFTLSGMFITLDLPEKFRSFSGMTNRLRESGKVAVGRPSTCAPMSIYGIRTDDLKRITWM
jgi:hypothetical protein